MNGNVLLFLYILILIIVYGCNNENKRDTITDLKRIELEKPKALNWIGHWKNEGEKGELVREIARRFEFENQDIKVNLQFPEDIFGDTIGKGITETEFYAKMITSKSSEWDIIRIDNETEVMASQLNDPLWAKKYLIDLKNNSGILSNCNPGIIDRKEFIDKWNNILPGIPIDGSNGVLWCNLKVAKKLGLSIKQFNMTFNDFESYLKSVYEYNQKKSENIIAIFDTDRFSLLDMIPKQLYYSEVGNFEEILDSTMSEKKWSAYKKTVLAIESLSKYNPLGDTRDFSWPKDIGELLNGEILFYPHGSWMYNIWLEMDSNLIDKIIPVQLPEFKESKTYLGEYRIIWSIPKNANNVDGAIKLMSYISDPQTADQWIRYTKSPTGIKNSFVKTTIGFDPYENFDYEINRRFIGYKIPISREIFSSVKSVSNNTDLGFKMLFDGGISAQEFLINVKSKLR